VELPGIGEEAGESLTKRSNQFLANALESSDNACHDAPVSFSI
jgi:hypothetical protein